MADSSTVAPVYGPRPYGLIEGDHRGIVLTVGILFTVYTFMVLGMRLAARHGNMGVDDWLSIVATVCSNVYPSIDQKLLTTYRRLQYHSSQLSL